ncbi:related to gEgh 16 protein [Phialocephala subalpina]|uniref:Related to gEgh 16 protein n=1 Tax=Phialocephala subalpina TaxID=576137 RepID=A0A1L7XKH1_9HELO|nr:related to gEgh 16 protein [Phialocephala subalpina]
MLAPSASLFIAALLASPLVSAHGKVAVVTGDLGGNGTALGIKGAVVAGTGSNSKTELDTTTSNVGSNNCGETVAGGTNKATTDQHRQHINLGHIPHRHIRWSWFLTALVDTSGVGNFSNAIKATVTTQVPGTKGNIQKTTKRWEELMIRAGLMNRATNINEDYSFTVAIPAGTTCTGTVAG